jgi:hypothetical protein
MYKMASIIDLTNDDLPLQVLRAPCGAVERWRGLEKGDGQYRLYRTIPQYRPGKIRRHSRKGRLMKSYTTIQLMKIAWKIGVTNPEGFDLESCHHWGCEPADGLRFFITGWTGTTKDQLMNHIWNHLYDTDEIHMV